MPGLTDAPANDPAAIERVGDATSEPYSTAQAAERFDAAPVVASPTPPLLEALDFHRRAHDYEACPGDFTLFDDPPHELIGTLHDGLPIVAVRTPSCERNGTTHVWVLTCDVAAGRSPHPCDWTYLR